MKKINLFIAFLLIGTLAYSKGLSVGDIAPDFRLKNVDGKYVSMSDYPDAKGFVVIFSCNHCPFVVAYEDRMIELHNKFAPKGFPVIAINSNDTIAQPQDSFSNMKIRAAEKGFPFPYLIDADQTVYPKYGATRTPEVYLLQRAEGQLKLAYTGTIDDNHRDAGAVNERYLANAIEALLAGRQPETTVTRAVGCSIKKR